MVNSYIITACLSDAILSPTHLLSRRTDYIMFNCSLDCFSMRCDIKNQQLFSYFSRSFFKLFGFVCMCILLFSFCTRPSNGLYAFEYYPICGDYVFVVVNCPFDYCCGLQKNPKVNGRARIVEQAMIEILIY